jgi:hypothetical protein
MTRAITTGTKWDEPTVSWPADPEQWYIHFQYHEYFLGPYADRNEARRALVRLRSREDGPDDAGAVCRGQPDAQALGELEWKPLPGIDGDPRRLYHVTFGMGAQSIDLKLRVSAYYNTPTKKVMLSVDLRDDARAALDQPQDTWREVVVGRDPRDPISVSDARLRLDEAMHIAVRDFLARVTDDDLRALGWLPKEAT